MINTTVYSRSVCEGFRHGTTNRLPMDLDAINYYSRPSVFKTESSLKFTGCNQAPAGRLEESATSLLNLLFSCFHVLVQTSSAANNYPFSQGKDICYEMLRLKKILSITELSHIR